MSDFKAKVLVVAKALPTYMTLLATLVTAVAAISGIPAVAAVAVSVAAWLTSAVTVIRRVTPVVEEQMGLLPK